MNKEWLDELLASQVAAEQEPEHISPLEWILHQMPFWKRWYLKRNQPKNYFRITLIIPKDEVAVDNPNFWICKFQIWKRSELHSEFLISAHTYESISKLPGWEELNHYDLNCFYYRNEKL